MKKLFNYFINHFGQFLAIAGALKILSLFIA